LRPAIQLLLSENLFIFHS